MSGEPVQLDLLDWLAAQPPASAPAALDLASVHSAAEPAPVFLTRLDPSCNMRRFYSVALAVSLFGETGVVRHWGWIGSQGQSRTDWYEASGLAEVSRQKLLTQKRQRGYCSIPES